MEMVMNYKGLTQYENNSGGWTGQDCDSKFREVDWGQAPYDVRVKLNID